MRQLVRSALGYDGGYFDEELWRWAHRILDAAGVAGHDAEAEVQAIFDYVHRATYRMDPTGGQEDIADARETIRDGWGDCDDLTILACTLLGFVGYPTRFVVIRQIGTGESEGFDHVYLEVLLQDRWVALDPTNPNAPLGWEAHKGIIERKVFSIFGKDADDHNLSLAGIGSFFKKLGKGLLAGASVAAAFVPFVGPAVAPVLKAVSAGAGAAQGFVGGGGGGSSSGGKAQKMSDSDVAATVRQITDAFKAGQINASPMDVWNQTFPIMVGGGPEVAAAEAELKAAVDAALAAEKAGGAQAGSAGNGAGQSLTVADNASAANDDLWKWGALILGGVVLSNVLRR